MARNRDLYMRKHHSAGRGARGALADGLAPTPSCAALAAACCPATSRGAIGATSARRCGPARGEGLREAAERYNRERGA